MTRTFLFVGEKPSETAHQRGLTWASGKLAAKTLFDALREINIDPEQCHFTNLFGSTPCAQETGDHLVQRVQEICTQAGDREIIVMGSKVGRYFDRAGITHIKLVHPAARGKIRGKAVYQAHVKERLLCTPKS